VGFDALVEARSIAPKPPRSQSSASGAESTLRVTTCTASHRRTRSFSSRGGRRNTSHAGGQAARLPDVQRALARVPEQVHTRSASSAARSSGPKNLSRKSVGWVRSVSIRSRSSSRSTPSRPARRPVAPTARRRSPQRPPASRPRCADAKILGQLHGRRAAAMPAQAPADLREVYDGRGKDPPSRCSARRTSA